MTLKPTPHPTTLSLTSEVTPLHQCTYLPDRAARLEIIELSKDGHLDTPTFSEFSRLGFRRSGQHLYRPVCFHCQRCISTRVLVNEFKPNRTQRKLWQKLQDIDVTITACEEANETHFNLYARYICARHSDGDMYPPNLQGFKQFLQYTFTQSFFMEFWQNDELVMVAVCDQLDDGISAVYTFYDPEATINSLGTLAILTQIDYVKRLGLPYLYLGFWVPNAEKMAYKSHFFPNELLINQHWYRFDNAVTPQQVEPLLQQAVKTHYLKLWNTDQH